MAAFFIAVPSDLISVTGAPKWGSLLTWLSWFLLVLLSYLLLVSFNKDYSYAILPVPIPIVLALLQLKLWPAAYQRIDADIEAGQDINTSDEAVQAVNNNSTGDQDLDGIFNLSAGIVNFGGLISMIIGHYITGPSKIISVNPAVFFFFFTVALGLYLMMVTTVRIAALTLHARHLSYLLMLLLLTTLIATLRVWPSGSDSHV